MRIPAKTLQPGQRIRVLAVDDSVVIRRLVTHALEGDPALEVVGVAANGSIALSKIPQVNPDVVTLDIEMPDMDGLEALKHIKREYPSVRVVMFSTLTERAAAVTLEALALGADDYVTKASNEGSLDRSLARLREELIPKVKQFFVAAPAAAAEPPKPAYRPLMASPAAPISRPMAATSLRHKPEVVAIGVSTGGPIALGRVLPEFPKDFPLPILIVQHMPPLFTQLLAERLNSTCQLPVYEAKDGDTVAAGKILIAPGDFHMKAVRKNGSVRVLLDQTPPQNSCRPAVDALFASVAETYGGATLAAVLTGMGQDGQRGAEILKARGAHIIAQDQESSVVWGMPGAVVNAGLASSVLPLDQVTGAIVRLASGAGMPRTQSTAPTGVLCRS